MIHNKKIAIKERRRRLASILAKDGNLSQVQLAAFLGCDQSTVSNDIKFLKEESRKWIFNLAKGDLCFQYQLAIRDIEQCKAESWKIYSSQKDNDFFNGSKIKLLALKVIAECNVKKFDLLNNGPSVLMVQNIQARIEKLEESQFHERVRSQIQISK